jgi:hypothetical protein
LRVVLDSKQPKPVLRRLEFHIEQAHAVPPISGRGLLALFPGVCRRETAGGSPKLLQADFQQVRDPNAPTGVHAKTSRVAALVFALTQLASFASLDGPPRRADAVKWTQL